MTSFNLILPELNDFITLLDGEDLKGLNIFLFSLTALLSRPFSGKLSDTIGRKKVMLIGMGIAVIISILYPLSFSVHFYLFLRLMHGFSAGFLPTGATALATDILPSDRRGRGMGVWGVFLSLGFGIGQSLGSTISTTFGMDNLFYISSIIALLSGVLLLLIEETLPKERQVKFTWKLLRVKWNDIFEPTVIPAAFVMFLSTCCTGMIFVITPDLAAHLGIENKGAFFTFYAFSTILIRLFTGSLSDNIGRRKTLLIGMFVLLISMVVLSLSNSYFTFAASGLIFGVATGISSPTVFAWMGDLAPVERRGVGSGTLFIALEGGIMLGSGLTLLTYDSTPNTFFITLIAGALFTIIGIGYLFWHLKFRESAT